MNSIRNTCPGCASGNLRGSYIVRDQPVILNYRFADPAQAQSVKRADVHLRECSECGLVFNAAFNAEWVPYDSNYENTQTHSPAFQAYLAALAGTLIERHRLQRRRILEVGCGKGDFLKLICELGDNKGLGYDTTYEGAARFAQPVIEFRREYLNAAGVTGRFDLVLCRHVIEHVPEIGAFLRELHAIARAAGEPVVYLETPRFEWILESGSFWDVFYEHCNYFTQESLHRLCERAGFEVLRQEAVFGAQYQALELKPGTKQDLKQMSTEPSGTLDHFSATVRKAQKAVIDKLAAAGAAKGWALWGAGAKGVALVNQLSFPRPSFVIDSNPAKHGCVIPGSNVTVIGPDDPRVMESRVILVANPNYFDEIKAQLEVTGFKHSLISL